MGIKGVYFLLLFLCAGCTQGHCRRQVDAPAVVPGPAAEAPAPVAATPSAQAHVFVYKYDGSMQCGMGRPVTVDQMAKELKGIQVFSQEKKSDGLMHIQVCGSITGLANIYEIAPSALKKAEARGFKKWSFE